MNETGIPLAENQRKLTPLQRIVLSIAHDEMEQQAEEKAEEQQSSVGAGKYGKTRDVVEKYST